jgi:hypothetical protein
MDGKLGYFSNVVSESQNLVVFKVKDNGILCYRFEAVCLLNDQVVFQDLLPERVREMKLLLAKQ